MPDLADIARVRFTAAVERAVAQLYDEARLFGHLDEPTTAIATRFAGHHRLHATSLESDVGITPTTASAALVARYEPRLRGAGSVQAAVQVLQQAEQALAATHLASLGTLHASALAATFAEILPIECQHDTVLGLVLGQPLSALVTADGKEPTAGALDPAQLGTS